MSAPGATKLRDVLRRIVGHTPAACEDEAIVRSLVEGSSSDGVQSAIRRLATAERRINQSGNKGLVFDSVGIALGGAFRPRA